MVGQAAQQSDGLVFDHVFEYDRPYLYPKQKAALFDPKRYSFIEASTKAGKAQPLDSLVYTPAGPVKMRDVVVGGKVLTPSGVATVRGVYPQGERDVLKVTFADGTVVEADAEHLWEVHRAKTKPRVVTTAELMTWGGEKLARTWVPQIAPALFEGRPVEVDPYLLGALIGDGGIKGESVMFSNADPEVLAAVSAALPKGHTLAHAGNHDYRITAGLGASALARDGLHLRGILQRMGLGGKRSHEKFVPSAYRYNDVDTRRAVLQGILDTDGFVDKHGQPGIEQTSELLARDITEMVQSLGGSVLTRLRPVNGYRAEDGRFVICRPVWRQVIRMADGGSLFRMSRKREACRPKKKPGSRVFISIEFARRAPTQCIEIDDDRRLYLTDGFIPTHNTAGALVWLIERAFDGQEGQNFWWVAPVSGQADIAFRRAMRAIPRDMFQEHIQQKTLTLPNGAIIWFKSADKPNSLYGEDVFAAVIDEASRSKEEAWHAVRSTVTATRGPIRCIGNVKGRRNWFYKMCRRAEKGDDPRMGYHKITAYDAVAARVLDAEEIDDAKSMLPDHVFRELYLAEASDDGGNPFGLAAIAKCVQPMALTAPRAFGIDIARKLDWFVALGIDDHGRTCAFDRFQLPWEAAYPRVHGLVGSTPALVDETGVGDPVLGRFQSMPGGNYEGYTFSQPSKQKLMEGLAIAISTGEVAFPEGPIKQELDNFEFEYTRTGVRYSAPEGYHDDCVMALALAVHHKTNTRPPMTISQEVLERFSRPGSSARGRRNR